MQFRSIFGFVCTKYLLVIHYWPLAKSKITIATEISPIMMTRQINLSIRTTTTGITPEQQGSQIHFLGEVSRRRSTVKTIIPVNIKNVAQPSISSLAVPGKLARRRREGKSARAPCCRRLCLPRTVLSYRTILVKH